MNRIYRLIWSKRHRMYVAGRETCISRGARGSCAVSLTCAAFVALAPTASRTQALPTGGQVVAGTAAISSAASALTIHQSSQRAAINWQSFSIGEGSTVKFQQPDASAVTLNRVVGPELSVISGALEANGNVFLLNSSGVLFTRGSQVNVGGIVASTLDMSDADFMAGRSSFAARGARDGAVVNAGSIRASDGGYVALLGGKVLNEGEITARLGTTVLAAGAKVSLKFDSGSMVGVTVDQGVLDALVRNSQAILADGGLVVLTARGADAVMSSLVRNTGEVRARTVANRGGRIYLLADADTGQVEVAGVLDASAPSGGPGGFIETSGSKVALLGDRRITTASATGTAGTWLIDPNDYTIASAGGDITGAQLGNDLANTNVIISSANGSSSGGNGDIFVNDSVAWNSNNSLTLRAHGDIHINESIVATGSAAKLTFEYGLGASAAGNTAAYRFAAGKSIGLRPGQNFDTRQGVDGTTVSWTVVDQLGSAGDEASAGATNSLQGIGHASRLSGNFVLGADIGASATGTWNSGLGFTPIGTASAPFSGRFDGLGHAIDGLSIDYASAGTGTDVGLFGRVSGARLANIDFTNVRVTGSIDGSDIGTGTLAGSALNTVISHVSVSGPASSNVLSSKGSFNLGGLVGLYRVDDPASRARVSDVSVQAEIRAGISGESNQTNRTGGIVGSSQGSTEFHAIERASFNGTIVDVNRGMDDVGGIIGYTTLTDISDSHAVVDFQNVGNFSDRIGGLIGQASFSQGPISQQAGNVRNSRVENSSASGTVRGASRVGGLVGEGQLLDITNSSSSATVTPQYDRNNFGGLIGWMAHGTITDSHATGDVTGGDQGVGGLAGELLDVVVTRSHATGDVSTNDTSSVSRLGGLIGNAQGGVKVIDSYATGDVMPKSGSPSSEVGGLIGLLRVTSNGPTEILNSYATGRVGRADEPFLDYVGGLVGRVQQDGAHELTIENSRYTGAGVHGRDGVGGLVGAFTPAGSNQISHIARSFSTAPVLGRDYVGGLVGQAYNVRIGESYAQGDVSGRSVVGAFAGEIATGYQDADRGYLVVYGIDPAYPAIRSEVRNSYARGSVTASGEKVGGFLGRALFADVSHVYSSGAVTGATEVGGLVGSNAYEAPVGENYGYDAGGNFVACAASAVCNYASWVQSGTTPATASSVISHGFWDIETSGIGTAGSAAGSAGGVGMTTASMRRTSLYGTAGWSIAAPLAGPSYPTLLFPSGSGGPIWQTYATVLGVSGTNVEGRVYDGTTVATVNIGALTGVEPGDAISVSAIGSYDSANAGARSVTVNYSLSGVNAVDYLLEDTTHNAVIQKRPLSVTGTSVRNKVYDGNTIATVVPGSLAGLVGSETLALDATGTFASAEVGRRAVTASYTLADGGGGRVGGQLSTGGHPAHCRDPSRSRDGAARDGCRTLGDRGTRSGRDTGGPDSAMGFAPVQRGSTQRGERPAARAGNARRTGGAQRGLRAAARRTRRRRHPRRSATHDDRRFHHFG